MEEKVFARQGAEEHLFERLFEYICNLNIDWIDEIKGITEKEIEEFENIFKKVNKDFKLPKSLYVYLKDMCINNGKIDFCCNISKIFQYNEIYVYSLCLNNIKIVEYIIIDVNWNGNIVTLIDLTNNGNIVESCINKEYKGILEGKLSFEDLENKEIKTNFINKKYWTNISDSLEHLLFGKAFEAYEKDRFCKLLDISTLYYNVKSYNEIKFIREMIENLFKKYNINKTWFAIFDSYYGYVEDLSICIKIDYYDYDFEDVLIIGFIIGENTELIQKIFKEIKLYKSNDNRH